MNVNERIKNRRIELGISVDELAEKLGINRATIYRYESEEISKLPASILQPLATALQTTPYYLMGWEETKSLSPVGEIVESLSPAVLDLARQIQQLDAEDRAVIIGEVRAMLRADKYRMEKKSQVS